MSDAWEDQWSNNGSGLLGILDPSMADSEPLPGTPEDSWEPRSGSKKEVEQPETRKSSTSGSPDVFINQWLPMTLPAIEGHHHSSFPAPPPQNDDNTEGEFDGPVMIVDPLDCPSDLATATDITSSSSSSSSPRVTQEQVNRQLQKCLRDGQELSRLLRKGTREWWMGPANSARKRDLRRRVRAVNAEMADIIWGRRRIGDAAQDLAADGLRRVGEGLVPILDNPARFSYDAIVAVVEHTAAPFHSIRRVVRGEHGSQATPCRYHVTTDAAEDSGVEDDVLVDVDSEDEEAATLLESPENWELV